MATMTMTKTERFSSFFNAHEALAEASGRI